MEKNTSESAQEKKSIKRKFQFLSIYVTNTRAITYFKETLLKLKSHIKYHTLMVEDFKIPLSPWTNLPDRNLTWK